MKETNFCKIKKFHAKFGRRPDPAAPTVTNQESRLLRGDLMFEEFKELIAELGLELVVDKVNGFVDIDLIVEWEQEVNLPKVAKEISDLLYVTYGTAASMGLPIDEVYAAVHESNMSKLGENGEVIRREDGKVLKGPNYKEPDIETLLKEHK